EVVTAYDHGKVDLHAKIHVRLNPGEALVETTVGRAILSLIVPGEVPYSAINRQLKKKQMAELIDTAYRTAGNIKTVRMLDEMKNLGYRFATRAGFSISMMDMVIPEEKQDLLSRAQLEINRINTEYQEGAITDGERYNQVIDVWAKTTEKIAEKMLRGLSKGMVDTEDQTEKVNSIFMMADSGARGSNQQMKQLAGMRGLMAKPSGEIIETPILANFREGLNVLEYFISTHGARKGLADTALKTANSGYLTRRLVDVAQDTVITQHDCGTLDGIDMTALIESGEIIEGLGDRVLGRVALEDVIDPLDENKVIVEAGQELTEAEVKLIEEAGIEKVRVRSILTCIAGHGACRLCYGRDLAH
ncbi:MAG: DNA-directed RNA polymerase subunit beta', partial [SAR324 cluster bacterium]|nr:DNA-directed RNA polymerase subunit beta' [SAR324 cluster bacterium]